MEIFDSFTDQIRGFAEPFIMIKDVVFDLLKPLKLLGKLFMPLLKGFGRLIKMIGLQIAAGLALVAVNLLRVLTDKKVLIGLGAMAALFGLKTLLDKAKGGENAEPGTAGDLEGEANPDQLDLHYGTDKTDVVKPVDEHAEMMKELENEKSDAKK